MHNDLAHSWRRGKAQGEKKPAAQVQQQRAAPGGRRLIRLRCINILRFSKSTNLRRYDIPSNAIDPLCSLGVRRRKGIRGRLRSLSYVSDRIALTLWYLACLSLLLQRRKTRGAKMHNKGGRRKATSSRWSAGPSTVCGMRRRGSDTTRSRLALPRSRIAFRRESCQIPPDTDQWSLINNEH